jgi:hypothetical protein
VYWRALRHARACSGVSGLTWARPLLAVARVSSAQGWHQQVQGSEGKLGDMVRGTREEWLEEWYGE